jgi:hypothetical protein
MKLAEKLLRHPLPDQLKALLEKFDGDFDASHLRALKNLANEPSFTRYERLMLRRAFKEAQVKLERDSALNSAMTVVLNLKDDDAVFFDAERYIVKSQVGGVMIPVESLYNAQIGANDLRSLMASGSGGTQPSQYAQGLRMHP